MKCYNCGDPATKFKPHEYSTFFAYWLTRGDKVGFGTTDDGEFYCNDCYDWVVSLDQPNPD